MKRVKGKKSEVTTKKCAIDFINKEIKKCTHFIFCYSTDDLNTTSTVRFNFENVEAVGVLEAAKHKILHQVLVEDTEDEE